MSDSINNTPFEETVWTLIKPRHDITEFIYFGEGWQTVANGYKQAGDLLADAVIAALPDDSPLVFPMLYCYRHFVELSAKDLIQKAGPFSGEPLEKKDLVHLLEQMMNRLNSAVPNEHNELAWLRDTESGPIKVSHSLGEYRQAFQTWCERFAKADPDSFRYRYPSRRDMQRYPFPNLEKELGVKDISALKHGMSEFDEAVKGMGSLIAALGDMEIDQRCVDSEEEKERA